jgi:hypothetical protein
MAVQSSRDRWPVLVVFVTEDEAVGGVRVWLGVSPELT